MQISEELIKQITKEIGNVESEVKTVDLQALKNSIERVEENLKDNVADTPTRIQNVSETIKKYKKTLAGVSDSLDKIEEKLKKVSNKPAAPAKKEEKDKQKEENKDTILAPTILM